MRFALRVDLVLYLVEASASKTIHNTNNLNVTLTSFMTVSSGTSHVALVAASLSLYTCTSTFSADCWASAASVSVCICASYKTKQMRIKVNFHPCHLTQQAVKQQ